MTVDSFKGDLSHFSGQGNLTVRNCKTFKKARQVSHITYLNDLRHYLAFSFGANLYYDKIVFCSDKQSNNM